MTAVMEPRSGQFSVTSSAVDLEPYPLAPNEPRRYFRASSICKSFKRQTLKKKKKIGKVRKVVREEKAWIGMRFYNGWSGEWGIGCLSFIDEDKSLHDWGVRAGK